MVVMATGNVARKFFEKITMDAIKCGPQVHILCNENIGIVIVYLQFIIEEVCLLRSLLRFFIINQPTRQKCLVF